MVHGTVVNIIADPRVDHRGRERVRRRLDDFPDPFLHGKDKVIELFLDLRIGRSGAELFFVGLVKKIDQVGGGIAFPSLVYDPADALQVCGVIGSRFLFVIQAGCACFIYSHWSSCAGWKVMARGE